MGDRRLAEIVSPDVIAVSPAVSVREGLDVMRRRSISCLIVAEAGLPVGIITERNILWAAAHRGEDFADRPVADLMSAPVVTVAEDTMLVEAYHLLAKKRLRHLVMVDAAGQARGVLTQSDLIERLGHDSLSEIKRVSVIMTREVVTAPGNITVREAVRRMADRSISCLIVARDARPAGIITERDVVRLLAESPHLGRLKLYDIMSCPVVCVEADRPVFEAAMVMKKRRMRRLVVVDDDRRVLGVVTQSDIVRGLESRYVRTLKSALAEKDEALREVGKSLVEKTMFLDNLLRSAEMGIVAADETWRITYVNPAAEDLFSTPAADLAGRDLREVHVQAGVDLGTVGRGLDAVSPTRSHDFSLTLTRGQDIRRYAVRISGIYDKEGVPAGFVLMARDDTERRQAEEHLERLTRNLEHLVVERTRDLTRQARELKEANERLRGMDEIKSAFLSAVSHELRTPLTSLLGFSKLIARDFSRHFRPLGAGEAALDKRGARIEDNLRVLFSEGERLARLLNDFLDLSRIESGRMEWRDREICLDEVVRSAVAAVAGLFASRPEVDLEMRLPDVPVMVLADPDRLEQVLINLIGNAAKFTAVGAVTVRLAVSGPHTARVSVSDTGPGIAAEDRELIFDKFRQVRRDPEGSAPSKGTGLGLAICREIVGHYGGRIWVEPAPGRGAAFLFELPTTDGQGVCPPPRSGRPEQRERPLVLVVDDDPAVSSFLIQFLEGEGYQVAAAHDGESALSAAEKLKPHAITMDMAMPGMDGRAAMAALRNDPDLAGIPVLVITGHEGAPPEGADAVLRKPLDPDRLLAAIEGLLARQPQDGGTGDAAS
ncbi:multi-sensor hybrid histidine kinase [Solidesulfovibrio carbinoliphilus subsp. oakridgensis]|uniref:histidine kinase n=1 Tax=Solidesulfovibrio carbinoliphilus subsp. oakridgensis TaxID=694327 RepID=G7QCV2_9BACT|nr:CBS domain-containing protein [Solidesulfovibrio carbinoliphilus]EHJ46258.1 multi-sensor hybrid histidine kinase [Solidesulfovibrio carbinoliphilus subsp. oakridgensis]